MSNHVIKLVILCLAQSSALSTENENYLNKMLTFYEPVIDTTYKAIDEDFDQGTDICTLKQACKSTTNFGVYSESGYSIDKQFNNISTNRDEIIFKKSISEYYNATHETKETLCVINDQLPLWKHTLDANPTGIKWQYMGMHSGDYGIYPAANWSEVNECPGTYNPTLRPWYAGPQSGSKDIIIGIDISDHLDNSDDRLAMAKILAKKFLSSLSFSDYFGIIVYSTFARPYDGTFLYRANSNDISDAEDYIDGLELDDGTTTNIGSFVKKAIDLFDSSEVSGDSSGCVKTIVLLTNGGNGIHDNNPVKLLDNENIKVFSYILSPGYKNPAVLIPSKMACATNGIVQTHTNYSTLDYAVESYGEYLSAGILNNKISWSPPYTDAFNQGRVITGGFQIRVDNKFIGVVAMDVTVSNITNDNITDDELITHLMENQVCNDFIYNSDVKEKQIELMGFNVCDNIESNNNKEEEDWIVHSWSIAFAMVIFACGSMYLSLTYCIHKNEKILNPCVMIMLPLMWLWFLLCFWLLLWPEIVSVHSYKLTTITVESNAVNGYECADKVGCSCASSLAYLTCSTMKNNLIAGECDDGHYCCKKKYYDCDCYTNSDGHQQCRTCSKCTRSVSNRQCFIATGTCYNPIVIGSFDIKDDIFEVAFGKQCSREDLACANDYLASFPNVGHSFEAYYDPSDVTDIRMKIGYSEYALGLTLFAATWIFLTYCYVLHATKDICKLKCMKPAVENKQAGKFNNSFISKYYDEESM